MDAHPDSAHHTAAGGSPTPSLFDCAERLDKALRSRRVGAPWLAEVEAKLHAYRACLRQHVIAADGERGWISELRHEAPRVESLARRTRADFAELQADVVRVIANLTMASPATRQVRHDIRRLVDETRRHRARCARLVHEALSVDLGVG
jgi:hypothetical protein